MSDTTQNISEILKQARDEDGRVSPSQFMRHLRPEYYSDSRDRVAYELDAALLEYHLETITKRNQTHDFEIFCRKLCERAICPNLRAQAGPDGGGDSKADTETTPVADEIISLTYVGEANAGKERWAFAFSAKEKWTEKARSDVKGIVETGRNYDRIFFVTSRFARSKDRSRLEDELTKAYSVPVTIHDRAWIVREIIELDRKDIAFNYLKVGTENKDAFRLGPTDYSRLQQLTESEALVEDPGAFSGMESQRVSEALLVAKLSRGLERPRSETEGRFMRAMRLADAHGSYRQRLEAQYEFIWFAFWWHDDTGLLNSAYSSFETLSLQTDHAGNLEFLCNLNQLLVNSVLHGLMSRDECSLDARMQTLGAALGRMSEDTERPNNRLEALTSLLIMRLNTIQLGDSTYSLSDIWSGYSAVLDEASGLGEFDFERAQSMIELAGNLVDDDPEYDALVEQLAEFVADRTSAAQGALVLLKRAQKLDLKSNLQIIRLLGRAAIGLTKKEHTESLIEALHLLCVAYRSAGLLWAARSTCVFAAASIVIDGERDSEIPAIFVPMTKLWAWIALELRHLPDFLTAIQLLNGSLATLPLDDDSKELVRKDLAELDLALGSILLNLAESELEELADLPDVLLAMGLTNARMALVYAMGHLGTMREEGSIGANEPEEELNRFFSLFASQPVAEDSGYVLTLNTRKTQSIRASVMGMRLELTCDGSDLQIQVSELFLASLEAFFATTLEEKIAPHTETFAIVIAESDATEPDFIVDTMKMSAILYWPKDLRPALFGNFSPVLKAITAACGQVLAAAFFCSDPLKTIETLFKDQALEQRLNMIVAALNSYHRILSRSVTRADHWHRDEHRRYELIKPLPKLEKIAPKGETAPQSNDAEQDEEAGGSNKSKPMEPPELHDHRDMSVLSVINIHAWDNAVWKGIAFAEHVLPVFALMFEQEDAAREIFSGWRVRFGEIDRDDAIRIAIVRRLPGQNPSHYCAVVSSKMPEQNSFREGRQYVFASRSMTMEPSNSVNLDRFLANYSRSGAYLIVPAILRPNAQPDMLMDLALCKRELTVKDASEVSEHEIDSIALRRRSG